MKNNGKVQLSMLMNTGDRTAVLDEIRRIFLIHYDYESFSQVENAFAIICSLFDGMFPGYRKCNTEYHNLTHTLDALLATSRLMDGRTSLKEKFDVKLAINLHLAALLHDTGYIQEDWDIEGTGAKYTKSHVERSGAFVEKNAANFHLSPADVKEISSLIMCTGLKADSHRGLKGEILEAGAILGTADLLGQMSDRAYLEKLLFLYYEFREAEIDGFNTTYDILRNTLAFYETTIERLDGPLNRSYDYALYHFRLRHSIDDNLYMTAIQNQMHYLSRIIEDETTNFRNKLKRLDVEKMEMDYTISRKYV
ncbi:MAG TPA: hypothetical protein P5120_10930 [Spirochaetota bacterium]|nr:hypothetical protein [Spirochaetota bacterium]HPJ42811.1 hypothetical protein [Spirochaetota bacterium]HPR38541.1 hypothetical protein [Spirochaetota bacterium]HRX48022.1 hypothetical protein [Spirochaetota bacterium]